MKKLQWFFELVDRISGPAKKIEKSLKSLAKAGGTKIKTSFESFGKSIKSAFSELNKSGPGKLVDAVKDIATVGAVAGVALAAAGTKYAVEMMAFKESSIGAFAALTGSAAMGQKVFQQSIDMAQFFGVSAKDTVDGVKDLLGAGFKAEEAMTIFQGALDLKRLKGADTKALTMILGQIKSKGKLQTEELLQLAESGGLAMGKVMEALGEAEGIDVKTPEGLAKLQKMLESGKITSEKAIPAVLESIKKLTGSQKIGEFAAKGKESLSGLWETIKSAPEQFMLRMNVDSGPLKDLAKTLGDALNPNSETGKKVMASLEGAINGVMQSLKGIDVAALVTSLASFLTITVDITKQFSGGFMSGLKDIMKPLMDVIRLTRDGSGSAGVFSQSFLYLGKVIGFIVGIFAYAIVGISAIAYGLYGFGVLVKDVFVFAYKVLADFFSWLAALPGRAAAWGTNIVDSLWNAIKAKWAAMIQGITGLTNLLPEAVKKALGIASPSKVFMNLGVQTMQGFQVGVMDQAANTNASVAGAISVPSSSAIAGALGVPSASAIAAGMAGAGGGGSVGSLTIEVNVDATGATDPRAVADATADATLAKVKAYFDTLHGAAA